MTLSFYVHIPYCVKRCGYCDFNTYTPQELQDGASLAQVSGDYIDAVLLELESAPRDEVATIFFGGGTPSLLPPDDLGRVITALRNRNGLGSSCEITLEANPDSVNDEKLARLREAGFNRISFGMQSTAPHILKVLDRTHNPENVKRAVEGARAAGFDSVSIDLIYGTPGESLSDWGATVDHALALETDHISAYALIIEMGTKLAAQIKRGEVSQPEDDLMADMYTLADEKFSAAGLNWYELSNWSKPGHECRHNIAYWKSENWWGLGPGAHSHINGERFWNIKHPNTYKTKLFAAESPIAEREVLTDEQKRDEAVMLQMRLREGFMPSSDMESALLPFLSSGHLTQSDGRFILTLEGRLIADRIVREVLA